MDARRRRRRHEGGGDDVLRVGRRRGLRPDPRRLDGRVRPAPPQCRQIDASAGRRRSRRPQQPAGSRA